MRLPRHVFPTKKTLGVTGTINIMIYQNQGNAQLSQRLTASSQKNPCPVCNGTNSACKSREDFVLCMTEADSVIFEIVNGWKGIGSSNGWGQFVPAGQRGRDPIAAKKQSQAKAEREALYRSGLNPAERQIAHSQLLVQLSLHEADRADLTRRGLSTATIEGFRSIEPGQALDLPINPKTPGVGFGGRKLLARTGGYLVPALDIAGRILGFQVRNRSHVPGNGPKYPWLSVSDVAPVNLPSGELPLTFVDGDRTIVNFAEGLLKPMVAAEKTGQAFIGAAGGNFASSPNQLRGYLSELRNSTLALCPDAASLTNPNVMRSYTALAELVEAEGLELKVRWYGQTTKADGDVDEISREQFEQSTLISWAEFIAMSEPAAKPVANTSRAVPLNEFEKQNKPQTQAQWAKEQKLERDRAAYKKIAELLGVEVIIDLDAPDYKAQARESFYSLLKKETKYEPRGKIAVGFAKRMEPATDGRSFLVYDASQGTGKSNNALIPAALRIVEHSGRVLIFVPTRGLAAEFRERINEAAGALVAATHLDPNFATASIVVSCPESAFKFKGQKFELIQCDEANEIFHRIESAELGNAGPQSLAAFRALLASTKVVEIASASLSAITVSAAQTMGGFTSDEVQLQRVVRPATPMTIIEYSDFYQWLQKVIQAVANGQRVAIPTGSQGKGRMIDRILRRTFPNKNGLVIDGAATMQNQRSRFLANPDAFLDAMKPDWFIFTPVINSGVSIEGKHFDTQFEYATPTEGAQSISQRGERIRSAIGRDGAISQRHIYFSQHGAPSLEAYPEAFDWQYWLTELSDASAAPMGAAAALAKALGAEKAIEPMRQDAEKFAGMRPDLPHFLALKAFETIFKKELLHEDWERFGWEVTQAPKPNGGEVLILRELKLFCDEVRVGLIRQKGSTLKKARTRDSEAELDEINNPFQAVRSVKAQLEKALGKEFLAAQDSDFYTAWAADKSADNPGIRGVVRSQLLAIAISNPDQWAKIEQAKALKFLAGTSVADATEKWQLPELPASARDIELASIISRCPGITDIISGKTERWTNACPQVVAAGAYLVAHGKQIAANTKRVGLASGAKFSGLMTPAALLNKALELMGYAPKKEAREGGGKRLNIYRLENANDTEGLLATLDEPQGTPLELFKAEMALTRMTSRDAINAAAYSRIMAKALAWETQAMERDIANAIAAIRGRHADLLHNPLTKLGDASELGGFGGFGYDKISSHPLACHDMMNAVSPPFPRLGAD
jgi:hypothetical protein